MPTPNITATAQTTQATLIVEPNLDTPDDFYEALIETHRDLGDVQSALLNARLVLLLANHTRPPRSRTMPLICRLRSGASTAGSSTRPARRTAAPARVPIQTWSVSASRL